MQLIAFAGIIEAQKATRTQRRSRSSTVIAGLATIICSGNIVPAHAGVRFLRMWSTPSARNRCRLNPACLAQVQYLIIPGSGNPDYLAAVSAIA